MVNQIIYYYKIRLYDNGKTPLLVILYTLILCNAVSTMLRCMAYRYNLGWTFMNVQTNAKRKDLY